MATIETKYQGEISISEADVHTFKHGIPGFPEETSFVFLPFAEESPFYIMQSVQTPALAFVVTDPFLFFQDYDFKLEENVIDELQVTSEKDVSVFVILTLADPFEQSTANLQAPLVLNVKYKRGKQIILSDERYTTRHSFMTKKTEED